MDIVGALNEYNTQYNAFVVILALGRVRVSDTLFYPALTEHTTVIIISVMALA